MPAHGGYNPRSKQFAGRIKQCRIAVNGLAWDHVTDSLSVGLKGPGIFRFDPTFEDAFDGGAYWSGMDCTFKVRSYQCPLTMIKNLIQLFYAPFGLFALLHGDDKYIFFTPNTASPITTPNGTRLISLQGMDFVASARERYVDLTFGTWMPRAEYKYMLANGSAEPADMTGGDDYPLVANEYDETMFSQPGVEDPTITNLSGGALPGTISEPSIKFSVRPVLDQDGRGVGEPELLVDTTYVSNQNAISEAAVYEQDMREESVTVLFPTKNGDKFKFTGGAARLLGAFEVGDGVRKHDISLRSTVPAGAIVWTDPTIMEFTRLGAN